MFEGSMFNLSPEQWTRLAMENDPTPVLQAFSAIPSGNFLTMPQPGGVQAGPSTSYEDIIQGFPTEAPAKPQTAAPLSDVALRTLAAMNPRDQQRFPAAGLGQRPAQFQAQPLGAAGGAKPLTLAQILGRG